MNKYKYIKVDERNTEWKIEMVHKCLNDRYPITKPRYFATTEEPIWKLVLRDIMIFLPLIILQYTFLFLMLLCFSLVLK